MVEHVVGVPLGRRGQPRVRAERSARAQLVDAVVHRRARIVCAAFSPWSPLRFVALKNDWAAISANKLYSLSTRKKSVFADTVLARRPRRRAAAGWDRHDTDRRCVPALSPT